MFGTIDSWLLYNLKALPRILSTNPVCENWKQRRIPDGRALIERFSWEIGFAAGTAAKAVPRNDRSYIAGSIFRALACAAQVIAAMNQPDSIYLPQDPSGNIQSLHDIRRQIVELEKARLELLALLQANDHPETIARSALTIAERLFGSERGDGGDDIA